MVTIGEEKYRNELGHLIRLQSLLVSEQVLPLRIGLHWQNLRKTKFKLSLVGVEGLVANPAVASNFKCSSHEIEVEVPPEYLSLTRTRENAPKMVFARPLFHPHVYKHGAICWGTGKATEEDIFLVDWMVAAIEYIQYVPERINPASPAHDWGREALNWYSSNRSRIGKYLNALDLSRLRRLVGLSKGIV
jgi:ubiquitin-protein ligase